MPLALTPSEQLTYSTVRIECETATGTSVGTGFFYRFAEQGEQYVPAIVTNRHVVEGARQGRIFLHTSDTQGNVIAGQHYSCTLEQFADFWIPHPDATVDLCALPIAALHQDAEARSTPLFYIALNASVTATPALFAELTALEDIAMIGYPTGIWDSKNNMPIIRRGITATPSNQDYEGRPEFMIDAACFPGSSGSPVFLYNVGSYASRDGATVIGSRIALLGILYAGPQFTAEGDLEIVTVPTQQKVVSRALIPLTWASSSRPLGLLTSKASSRRDHDVGVDACMDIALESRVRRAAHEKPDPPQNRSDEFMKKRKSELHDWLRPEYKRSDFGKFVRGKYARQVRASTNVVVLDPQVAKVSPNDEAVNAALRGLMEVARSSARRPSRSTRTRAKVARAG
ncbi:MAG: serine protease [Nitrospirota bacterium]